MIRARAFSILALTTTVLAVDHVSHAECKLLDVATIRCGGPDPVTSYVPREGRTVVGERPSGRFIYMELRWLTDADLT